jgi:catechol 2,3-dioxygenase-like lactoylglutathione lyase family enzyme
MRAKSFVPVAAAAALLAATTTRAAEVIGVGNFSHIVASLERSIDFYERVLDLEPNVAPTAFSPNPAIMRLGDTLGAQSRIATFRIPGSELGVELIEYKDIDRHPVQARFQHPGATVLQLRVRALDSVLARLADSAGQIWTPTGEPITLGEATRIIFIQDPDGFFVELIESAATAPATAPESSEVIGGSVELIIADSDTNARFYREGLGFEPQVSADFDDTKLLTDTVDAPGSRFRRTALTIPGTSVAMAFLEFQGIYRKPFDTRVQDPGTAILQLFVDDVPAMTAQLAAAGGRVISTGGQPVDIGGGRLLAIVRDPNNLFLELLPPRSGQ